MDDLLRALDRKECILVALLDLSPAFDTVSHTILLQRLIARLGLSGSALACMAHMRILSTGSHTSCPHERIYLPSP